MALAPAPSATRAVNDVIPADVGVPLIAPLPASSARPGGNRPEVMSHATGAVPPVARKASSSGTTWAQVFGAEAEEAFAAYHVATYVNAVAEAGKKAYPLPLSVNVPPAAALNSQP